MLESTLAAIVGAEAVRPWSEVASCLPALADPWANDYLNDYFVHPPVVVYPRSVAALGEVVRCAHRENWPLLPLGQGTKLTWLTPSPQIKVVVSTAALNRVTAHAIADLTVTAEAGICFNDLQAHLAPAGQFIALDPKYPDQGTLGGIAATRDSGSLAQGYGTLRDHCLGIQFVRNDGQIVKAGSRVVKNVAGYDLMKLLMGSFGTLGILTELTLRVYPLPEARKTWLLTGNRDQLSQGLQSLLQSSLTPAIVDLLTGDYLKPMNANASLGLRVQFQGLTPVLTAHQGDSPRTIAGRLHRLAQEAQLTCEAIPDTADFSPKTFFPPGAIALKIGCLPHRSTDLVHEFFTTATHQGLSLHTWMQAGRGVGVIYLQPKDTEDIDLSLEKNLTQLIAFLQGGRSLCQRQGGYLTLLQASPNVRKAFEPWGYGGNALTLMKKIKEQFDPTGILNPDAFLGGL